MYADFHLHTHHSDGTWSPSELIEHAAKIKLTHIAITDHDTTAGIEEAHQSAAGRLEIIPGLEINTLRALEDGNFQDIHILGYFIDSTNLDLQKLLLRQRKARMDHIENLVANLRRDGYPITMDHIRHCAGLGSVGKAHLTKALVDCGMADDIMTGYEKFVAKQSPYYLRRKSAAPEEAIEAINRAGGFASIAHPGKSPQMMEYILYLKSLGLKGVEAFHRMHSNSMVKQYVRFANRNSLILTGGSDCHGPYGEFKSTAGCIALPKNVITNFLSLKTKSHVRSVT